MNVKASEAVADYFYEQCCGDYPGHMGRIPNNPNLWGLMQSHAATDRESFARFLRTCAEHLEKEQPF